MQPTSTSADVTFFLLGRLFGLMSVAFIYACWQSWSHELLSLVHLEKSHKTRVKPSAFRTLNGHFALVWSSFKYFRLYFWFTNALLNFAYTLLSLSPLDLLVLLVDDVGAARDTSRQVITSSRKKTIRISRYVRDVMLLNSLNKTGIQVFHLLKTVRILKRRRRPNFDNIYILILLQIFSSLYQCSYYHQHIQIR